MGCETARDRAGSAADHICPWQACYRSTQLLGGESRFILSTNGHIASLVNPPGNPRSTFQVAEPTPADPQEWLASAETQQGSWWPDYLEWLGIDCCQVLADHRWNSRSPPPAHTC